MIWFVAGILMFVVTLIGFLVSLALWTYKDAEVKSRESPLLWVLIVLIVPNLIGLIVYLLVGRTNKQVPAPGKYKKLTVTMAGCFTLGIAAIISGTLHFTTSDIYGAYGARQTGSFVGLEDGLRNGVWSISAERANGQIRRTPSLSLSEMETFRLTSTGSGDIRLRLEQGNLTETHDISGDFDDFINLQRFSPGRIIITVEFDQAWNIKTALRWR
jgi:hypothetical protein